MKKNSSFEIVKQLIMIKYSLCFYLIIASNFIFCQTAEEHYQNAVELASKNDFKGALKSVNSSLEKDDKNADIYILKAQIQEKLEKYKEAYETYSTGISKSEKNLILLYNARAIFLTSIQENDLAISDYKKAMELADSDSLLSMTLTNRAVCYIQTRKFEDAYVDLIDAYKIDSMSVTILTNLGAICDELGKGDMTLVYLLKAHEIDPTFYPILGNIGYKYQEMGQHEKAIEYYNKVLEINPEEPLGFSNRSYNKLKLGDLKGAMKDIEKSIDLYPANSYAYRIRALILIEEKKYAKACLDIELAINKGFVEMYGDEVLELKEKYCK